jgi:filamentous hemagglutinin
MGAMSGANGALGADLYNRQLHPEEKTLAKYIADQSNGQYTQAEVEDQMRIMGVCVNGGCVAPGVAEELNGRAPTDLGAKWINTGLTDENGNPLIIEALPEPNQALQTFIMENYNSATPGQVPSQFTYQPSPTQIDLGSVKSTTAAVADFGATQLDRTSAVATAFAAAGRPIPYISVPASSIAVWASAGSWLLNGVQQAVSPDLGNYSVSTLIGQIIGAMTANYPMAAPVINEFGNITSNSAQAQSAQNWANTQWSKLKGSPSEKN